MRSDFRVLFNIIIFCVIICTSCFSGEKFAESMGPVFQGALVLKSFYQASDQLPNNDAELLEFCAEQNEKFEVPLKY